MQLITVCVYVCVCVTIGIMFNMDRRLIKPVNRILFAQCVKWKIYIQFNMKIIKSFCFPFVKNFNWFWKILSI